MAKLIIRHCSLEKGNKVGGMGLVDNILQRNFRLENNEVQVGEISVSEIVREFQTPLFVYSSEVLDKQWSRLRGALPSNFSISYSVKANPNQAILRHFLKKGCGLEIASAGEFFQALEAGCLPENILFAGAGKTEDELEFVLNQNIGEIHIESFREVERIDRLCRRLGKQTQVAIRVNPDGEALGGAMRMGGKPAPFGIDEECLDSIIQKILSYPSLHLQGIHFFAGTQILDYQILLAQFRKGLEVAKRVGQYLNQPLHTVDFGGGLGIPYFTTDKELDTENLREGLIHLMGQFEQEEVFVGTRFMVEPGRFLVGESGIYVTKITDIKVSRGKKFIIVDGGMNHHLAASGNLGQVIKRNFPVAVLNNFNQPAEEVVNIVGPLCTPLDTIARDIRIPVPQLGDLVGVFQSGAYARTSSPMSFLSHWSPPEVLIENGTPRLIRRRGTIDDLFIDIQ